MAKVLLVEDDMGLADLIKAGLKSQNYQVEHLTDGSEAIDRLKFYHFDVAVLDWNLPGLTGVEICKEYRAWGGKVPVIMLTGKHLVSDKEEAFSIGADDYLTKPFAFRELAARIRALMRRPHAIQKAAIQVGRLYIDLENKVVTIDGDEIDIKPAEYAVLELFMKSPGRVFSSDELLAKLYSSESEATDEAVRQRILRLRKTLKDCDTMIKTVKGLGYKLDES
jgi:DNA-binding response OmpR family regulator